MLLGKDSFKRICLPRRLSTPLLASQAREMKMDVHTKTCTWMGIIHNSPQTGNKPNLHQQVNERQFAIYPSSDNCSARKRKYTLDPSLNHCAEWKEPAEKGDLLYIVTKSRTLTAWNLGKEELTAKEHERTFWNNGHFLSVSWIQWRWHRHIICQNLSQWLLEMGVFYCI